MVSVCPCSILVPDRGSTSFSAGLLNITLKELWSFSFVLNGPPCFVLFVLNTLPIVNQFCAHVLGYNSILTTRDYRRKLKMYRHMPRKNKT